MNEQINEQQQPVPVQMNGGVYPDENGGWRVVVWFSGIRGEPEAHRISGWLNGLLQAHLSKEPPNPEPPRADSNGAAPPRPEPSVPFAKS
jgi:hypothetical protein